jgi:Cu-Zn family superoxide dismutase
MSAIAVFDGPKVKGTVCFKESDTWTTITLCLSGLKKNAKHGFHIHEYGDLSNGCESMGPHFNPYKKNHGGPRSSERHVGDLGNIETDRTGSAKYSFRDSAIKLHGKANIIGRGLVIHSDPDDFGVGGHDLSLTTGNSGKRLACSVIALKGPNRPRDSHS